MILGHAPVNFHSLSCEAGRMWKSLSVAARKCSITWSQFPVRPEDRLWHSTTGVLAVKCCRIFYGIITWDKLTNDKLNLSLVTLELRIGFKQVIDHNIILKYKHH